MGALLPTLQSALGDFTLLDMTLPRGAPSIADQEVMFGFERPLSEWERDFLGRFRQQGGRVELDLPVADGSAPRSSTALSRLAARQQKLVVLVSSIEQAQKLSELADLDASIIVQASGIHRPGVAVSAWLKQRRSISIDDSGGIQMFLWMMTDSAFDAVGSALPVVKARRKRSHGTGRKSVTPRRSVADRSLTLDIAARAALLSRTVAGALIHDGGYRSESKGDYSWLWTGPSNHFRILVTGVPAGPAWLSVSIIKTEDARNLSGLRVMLDGRHVPHTLEQSSDLSGKVTVELGVRDSDMTVLSLVCPHVVPDAAGQRRLGLCIDRIELST
jgi:hypothetical protein